MWCASRLVGASLLKSLEGFVFVSGMNALNVKLVKAHWHECSIETMPTYIPYMQTFAITKDLPRALFCKLPCWRSMRSHALSSSPKLASKWRDEKMTVSSMLMPIVFTTTFADEATSVGHDTACPALISLQDVF